MITIKLRNKDAALVFHSNGKKTFYAPKSKLDDEVLPNSPMDLATKAALAITDVGELARLSKMLKKKIKDLDR